MQAHGREQAPPLRIAMLGAFPPQSQGVQDYCREIAVALADTCQFHGLGFRKMYPRFLFPGVKEEMDPTKQCPERTGLSVEHRLTWYNPFGWMRAGLTTPADVFHVQWWSLPLWPVTYVLTRLMRLRRIPVVATLHNVLPHEAGAAYIRATRSICRLADAVIVHSEENRRQLLSHYGMAPERAHVVPLGAYMAGTEPVPAAEARARLGLPPTGRLILQFGVIRDYKGIDILIRALAALGPDFEDVRLIIAGKPWTSCAPYQQLIAELGLTDRVHLFPDYIPEREIPLYFGAADLTVLPYRHFDAQSGVCAVAMPYRKPVIVSDVGGLPDWVSHNPDWVIPAGDTDALAARLRWFFSRQDIATQEFRVLADRMLEAFSWPSIAQRHTEIYRSVLRRA